MKRYIKDGIIKTRNNIVLHVTKEVNGKETNLQVINPSEEMILADGWVEYIKPVITDEEQENNRKLYEIQNLKNTLSNTDYKVIKCIEAYLCGEELPYDINALHIERNAQRLQINTLENKEI